MEKFSSRGLLEEELRLLESQHVKSNLHESEELMTARSQVLNAVEQAQWSRYELGKALESYRIYFKAERGWMEASEAIGKVLCSTSRTVRNIVADYGVIKRLPQQVIEVAQSKGIDLAKRKFMPAVHALETTLNLSEPADPSVIDRVMKEAMKKSKQTHDEESLYLPLTQEEKVLWRVRLKIRTAVNNLPNDQKLAALIAAVEEEMFVVWGQKQPVSLRLNPHQSVLTVDGRKRKRV